VYPVCHVHLFRNGHNQVLCIPREFELPGKEVIIHKEGSCLIIEPIEKKNNLSKLLENWVALEEDFPNDFDFPADDIDF